MTIHGRPGRAPLTRERVLQGALKIADARGLGSLTIRSLATALGVTPMSVYGHVANKGAILDGLVDLVFAEIALPQVTGEWREEMRRRAYSARAALTRHSWAIALMESRRTPGPATLRHHDATLAVLLAAGFSRKVTATAYALLDSYTYGFALQESALLFTESDGDHAAVEPMLTQFAAGEYPHLLEMTMQYYLQPGYAFGDAFDIGLNAILDAVAAASAIETAPAIPPGLATRRANSRPTPR